jgi:hypothetical protein
MAKRKKADPQFRRALRKELAAAVEKSSMGIEEIAEKIGGLSRGCVYQFIRERDHHVPRSDHLFLAMKELGFGFDFAGFRMQLQPTGKASRRISTPEQREIQLELFCNAPTMTVELPALPKKPTVRVLVQFAQAKKG